MINLMQGTLMEVVKFTKKPPKEPEITADHLLTAAVGKLSEVIILGSDSEGLSYLSTTIQDKAILVYFLEQLKFDLLAGAFDDQD